MDRELAEHKIVDISVIIQPSGSMRLLGEQYLFALSINMHHVHAVQPACIFQPSILLLMVPPTT